ncbi:sodium-coupled monocarboxylate transporter 1-like [Brevipalpus obovatus]|uniref:sodium-coupled monocarboxylate transporter 1-like n=1 Tax=Brevipalpus obovatus TaxID=246614 RepID=UPI003D9F68AF
MDVISAKMNSFSFYDYTVFVLMLLSSSAIGVYYAIKDRQNKSSKEFLTANRSLHWFPVAMSLMASFQSSVTILGYPAEMYFKGTQFWVVIISACLAAVTAAELFLPIYYGLSFTSVNKYLSLRFGTENVRLASSIAFLFGTVPYMGVVLYGPSLALASVTQLSVSWSIIVIGAICTFYTSIGGIRAVVWTDTLQVGLMFCGLIAVMARGFYLVGGVSEAFRIAGEHGRIEFTNMSLDPYSTSNFWNAVFGMGIMWCGNYCTTQTEVQRYCNVDSKKKAKLSIYVNLVGVIAIISVACLSGIAIFAYYVNCDPYKAGLITKKDQLVPYFVMETLSDFPGLPGLFVSGVFSASLSTLSSGFNALSAVTWDDFLKQSKYGKMSESKIKIMNKLTAAFYGILTIIMAFLVGQIGSVLQAAISLAGCLVGPLLGLYLIAILCPFANSKGVMTGLLSGISFSLFILFGSLAFPAMDSIKETSIDGCIFVAKNATIINPTQYYETEGILKLFHIAFLLVPIIGFVLSFVIGIVASILFGGQRLEDVDTTVMSKLIWKIWPSSCLPPREKNVAMTGITMDSMNANITKR